VPGSGRDRILQAAVTIAERDGSAALTLDAVADEARISKGGLLYHFPTKEALLRGLVDNVLGAWHDTVARAQARDPELSGGGARAYVTACATDESTAASQAALLAAMALDRNLRNAWRELTQDWMTGDREDAAADPVDLLLARLAADGLWLATLFDLYDVQGPQRDMVVRRILELTRRGTRA
jgi:AcrR family transcriptional regulator